MGAVRETWRGATASLRWLAGAPVVNRRIVRSPPGTPVRPLIAAHCQRFLDRCGIEVEVSGAPPPPGTGCVLTYNETSFADVVAFSAVMWPHADRAAAADLYRFIPFARAACDRAGIALVPRGNRAATDRLLEEMVAAVRGGARVAWGGEGRLSGIDGVARFKVGSSLIAIRGGVPLVPVAFQGGHRSLPLGSVRARPGTIRVRFGDPIDTTGLAEAEARTLADRAQAEVAALYAALAA